MGPWFQNPHKKISSWTTKNTTWISLRGTKIVRLPFPAVKLTKICPAGVHVPSAGEAAAAAVRGRWGWAPAEMLSGAMARSAAGRPLCVGRRVRGVCFAQQQQLQGRGKKKKKATSPLCCVCERRRSNTRREFDSGQTEETQHKEIEIPGRLTFLLRPQRKQFTLMIHLASKWIQELVHTLDVSVRTTVSHVELIPLP